MTPRERAETICDFVPTTKLLLFYVERLISAAVAEEREACAKIGDEAQSHRRLDSGAWIAERIRARST